MTSRNCAKDYHPGWKLFLFTLKRQTGITLLVTAILFLICPGTIWRQVVNTKYYGSYGYDLCNELPIWAIIIFAISLILGVILLCYNHSHLFSKKSADLYYSIPIRRDSFLLIRSGASAIGAVFAMTVSFSGLTAVNFMSGVNGIELSQMLNLYALVLLLLLLCLSTVLIFIVNAGGIFQVLFSTAVVCAGIPALCLIGYYWFREAAYGVSGVTEWMQYISPFGYAIVQLSELSSSLNSGEVTVEVSTLLICVGATLLFTAIAVLMNHNRKTEKSGSSYAYAAMPVLITLLAAAMGGYLVGLIFSLDSGTYGPSYWLYFSLGAALSAVASGAIISKSFRKIWRWFVCAGAATAVTLCLFLVTDYMGKNDFNYVPQTARIQSVRIEGTYESPTATLYSDFELVTQLHEHLLEEYNDNPYFEYDYTDLLNAEFDITYTLDNGKTVSRTYWIADREGYEMLLKIVQTDEYTKAWAGGLDMSETGGIQMEYYASFGERTELKLLTPEETVELLQVYAKELQNASASDLWLDSEDYVSVYLVANNQLRLSIPATFDKTLALVDELLRNSHAG